MNDTLHGTKSIIVIDHNGKFLGLVRMILTFDAKIEELTKFILKIMIWITTLPDEEFKIKFWI